VTLPEATTIGDYAFATCQNLTSVTLPEATTIGIHAFQHCNSLISVTLPAATTIGDEAFYGCDSLTSVTLPVATTIGVGAFSGCHNLTSVTLPVVTDIGIHAFFGCRNLTSVTLPASLSTVEGNPFAGCTALTNISVDAGNPNFSASGGMLMNKAGTTLIAWPSVSGPVTLNGITTIGNYAFYYCTSLTSVSLPEATTIGNYAFANTGPAALTVTLGAAPPTLGINIFGGGSLGKTVTVKVPSIALSAYGPVPDNTTDNNWGNAFRGKGWNGISYLTGTVNGNISLAFTTY
jgi:hypothetical protein